MKKNLLSIIFLLACPFVFADFAYDVMSHTMLSYLYDDILIGELSTLNTQYKKHIEEFNTQETKKIKSQLDLMLKQLNTPPPDLKSAENTLNISLARYNQLIRQKDQKVLEKARLQHTVNTSIKREQKEVALQLEETRKNIHTLMTQVNQKIEELMDQQQKVNHLYLFYDNQEYMFQEHLQSQLASLREWSRQKKQVLSVQTKAYNQAVLDFKTKQAEQNTILAEQRDRIQKEQQKLQADQAEINALIDRYNRDRESACVTEQCISALEDQRDLIEQKKQEHKSQTLSFKEDVSRFNSRVKNGTQMRQVEINRLDQKKQELEQLQQDISLEREQKKQAWEKAVQTQKTIARTKWEQAHISLSQLQSQLATDYGEDFSLFLDKLTKWSQKPPQADINKKPPQADINKKPPHADILSLKQDLCEYQALYPSAQKAQALCEYITKWHTLSHKAFMLNNQALDLDRESPNSFNQTKNIQHEFLNKISQIEGEIAQLEQQIHAQYIQTEHNKNQLESLVQQYQAQQSHRETQYKALQTQLESVRDKKNQFIKKAYEKKAELLNREYDLLQSVLMSPSTSLESALSAWRESLRKFNLLMSGQDENGPKGYCFVSTLKANVASHSSDTHCSHYVSGFSTSWTKPFRLMSVVYSKALDSAWLIPPSGRTNNTQKNFLLTSHLSREKPGIYYIEGEEKRELILSWMHTPFISVFLKQVTPQMSILKAEDNTLEDVKIRFFIQYLFGQSFYQNIPFQKQIKSGRAYYQISINQPEHSNDLLQFLPDGALETAKGMSQ